jgi:hypothetical protein
MGDVNRFDERVTGTPGGRLPALAAGCTTSSGGCGLAVPARLVAGASDAGAASGDARGGRASRIVVASRSTDARRRHERGAKQKQPPEASRGAAIVAPGVSSETGSLRP